MNIPENTLQQVADAAFAQSPSSPLSCVQNGTNWKRQPNIRRAIIQHAITNPALAPFMAGAEPTPPAEQSERESISLEKQAIQEAAYILNHYDRKSHADHVCLGKKLLREGWKGSNYRLPAAEATPPAEPEPAAQVPLGPEDYPPGSVLRFAEQHWYNALYVSREVICLVSGDSVAWKDWNKLQDDGWQINTSIPDTGRWDKDAWRPCSKPGKEVEK